MNRSSFINPHIGRSHVPFGQANPIMENNIIETRTILTTVVDTLIDQVSHLPVVFDEALLPKVLTSLSDSIQTNPMSRVVTRILAETDNADLMEFELFEVDPDDEEEPEIYHYRLSRTLEGTRYTYVLELMKED